MMIRIMKRNTSSPLLLDCMAKKKFDVPYYHRNNDKNAPIYPKETFKAILMVL